MPVLPYLTIRYILKGLPNMNSVYEVPPSFWAFFRSGNRDIYMDALLSINDEYQYSNYFLSREACLRVLSDMCSGRRYTFEREETETEEDEQQALPRRILNWLLKTGWLRRVEDYNTMTTNIVIPDYAAVFIDAFDNLINGPAEDTRIYIQNVYATLFSFRNDNRMNLAMLRTALINTRKLNKALQDMLHNMDRFFGRLLRQQTYKELLKEHLEGYVEEMVKDRYHILKTSDNFYIYKMDIKRWLKEMREDDEWVERIRRTQAAGTEEGTPASDSSSPGRRRRGQNEDVLELLDQIERGFDDIEHRITNMDKEHSKYVRATVNRLNYLLNEENDQGGLMIRLLNRLGEDTEDGVREERLRCIAGCMNLTTLTFLQENPLYKRRKRRGKEELPIPDQEHTELSMEEVLRLNKLEHRFTGSQIEEFIEQRMEDGILSTQGLCLQNDEEFEKLILAYDICTRRNSRFTVKSLGEMVNDGPYSYPAMLFVKKE